MSWGERGRWRDRIERLTYLKSAISLGAFAALAARMIWPWLKLDAVSLGLLIVAVIPWVSGLFESLELPGGWKISFRKLQSAAEAIPDTPRAMAETDQPSYLAVQDIDPELALVGLRIEIESRLQKLAVQHRLDVRRSSASALMSELVGAGVLPSGVARALEEVISAANAAAHGAEVPLGARDFAFTEGPRILGFLESLTDIA